MLKSLGKAQNPLIRSLTIAATVGSAVTMAGAIALGATNAKDNGAYQAAVYAVLAGTGCGAVLGLLYPSGSRNLTPHQRIWKPQSIEQNVWKTWRNFVVVRKVKESEEITSFYLQPEDKQPIPNFKPGQFLTIKLNIPGQANPVIRTYSLSDYAEPCEYYRISVKREPMPAGSNFMPGIASNYLHDRVQEGDLIAAKPPSGKFILDVNQALPAVLISNGVGITPMICMAKAVARLRSQRTVWFVHGARNGQFHAFREEIAALAEQNSSLHLHFAYSRPQVEDTGHYHSTGYVDAELIRSLVQQEAEYFLCGSPPFLTSLRQGLQAAGVPQNRIFFEAFTKVRSSVPEPNAAHSNALDEREVVFAASGSTATWRSGEGSLLEFAEANDLEPPYSCRQGICGTCMCRILEGEVEYQETPVAAIDDGSVLICISQPKTSKVVLDL